jgi:hypothetical protein
MSNCSLCYVLNRRAQPLIDCWLTTTMKILLYPRDGISAQHGRSLLYLQVKYQRCCCNIISIGEEPRFAATCLCRHSLVWFCSLVQDMFSCTNLGTNCSLSLLCETRVRLARDQPAGFWTSIYCRTQKVKTMIAKTNFARVDESGTRLRGRSFPRPLSARAIIVLYSCNWPYALCAFT